MYLINIPYNIIIIDCTRGKHGKWSPLENQCQSRFRLIKCWILGYLLVYRIIRFDFHVVNYEDDGLLKYKMYNMTSCLVINSVYKKRYATQVIQIECSFLPWVCIPLWHLVRFPSNNLNSCWRHIILSHEITRLHVYRVFAAVYNHNLTYTNV